MGLHLGQPKEATMPVLDVQLTCVIENGIIRWYDPQTKVWEEIEEREAKREEKRRKQTLREKALRQKAKKQK